jgi:hypothetical protein
VTLYRRYTRALTFQNGPQKKSTPAAAEEGASAKPPKAVGGKGKEGGEGEAEEDSDLDLTGVDEEEMKQIAKQVELSFV